MECVIIHMSDLMIKSMFKTGAGICIIINRSNRDISIKTIFRLFI